MKILDIISKVLDMLPSRREAILNEIDGVKNDIKRLQAMPTTWTAVDSATYYNLVDRLSKLEARAKNAGIGG